MPGLAEAKADLKIAAEQIATATTVDELKAQLLDNLVPAMEGVVTASLDELTARDEVIATLCEDVDDLQEGRGEMLEPETTGKILATFELGNRIAAELEKLVKGSKDEVTKKRCASLLKSYRQSVLVNQDYLAEITIPVDDEAEGDDAAPGAPAPGAPEEDGDDDDEGDDEEEGDEDDGYDDADTDDDEEEDDDDDIAAEEGR
jgi:hypothetical protein